MKHTKAPWYVKFMDENNPDSDFWVKSDVNPKVHYGTDIMCDDYGEHNGYPREQRLADAKLIAAAPELLAVCQMALESAIDGSYISGSRWWGLMKEAVKKATK